MSDNDWLKKFEDLGISWEKIKNRQRPGISLQDPWADWNNQSGQNGNDWSTSAQDAQAT